MVGPKVETELVPRRRRGLLLLVLSMLLGVAAVAQQGTVVLPRNLNELANQAHTIIRGHVISTRFEPHPELKNLSTVVVTLRVTETLKGHAGPTFTFRQYVWDIRDRYQAAGYRKGEELLLLMNAPSEYGLSSPAGLEQGRFRLFRNAQGNTLAVNGRANAGLFRGVGQQLQEKGVQLSPRLSSLLAQHRSGPVPLSDLEEVIRAAVKK